MMGVSEWKELKAIQGDFDGAVVATGIIPRRGGIDGIDHPKVLTSGSRQCNHLCGPGIKSETGG